MVYRNLMLKRNLHGIKLILKQKEIKTTEGA